MLVDSAVPVRSVFVSGLASQGKARFIAALERRLHADGISVRVGTTTVAANHDDEVVLVHAESDLEALVEGRVWASARAAADAAEVVVRVDWEPAERSVDRVVGALRSRGIALAAVAGR